MSEDKLRVGYFADGPWSHRAFEYLVKDNSIEIDFIVPRTDTQDDTLKRHCVQHGIDYLHPVKVNSDDFYDQAKARDCDVFVSMSFNQIFRKRIIELPRLQTINCHAGKLPFYRGRNILNWALINDEKEFGITVHFVDEGIDTGDILLQETFPITDNDTYGSLLEIAYEECARLLYRAIKKLQSGNYSRIPQNLIHPIGFYCGRRMVGDEMIDWNRSSREVFNFIRALADPGPGATTTLRGHKVKIDRALYYDAAPIYKNTIGQILSKTEDGYLVKTADSFVEVKDLQSEISVKVGDRLGS